MGESSREKKDGKNSSKDKDKKKSTSSSTSKDTRIVKTVEITREEASDKNQSSENQNNQVVLSPRNLSQQPNISFANQLPAFYFGVAPTCLAEGLHRIKVRRAAGGVNPSQISAADGLPAVQDPVTGFCTVPTTVAPNAPMIQPLMRQPYPAGKGIYPEGHQFYQWDIDNANKFGWPIIYRNREVIVPQEAIMPTVEGSAEKILEKRTVTEKEVTITRKVHKSSRKSDGKKEGESSSSSRKRIEGGSAKRIEGSSSKKSSKDKDEKKSKK